LLIEHKAEVNAKSTFGETPLHFAAAEDHTNVAELLLANHAEVNAKDSRGWTPLHIAAAKGYKDVVKLLLANKAGVNIMAFGGTPLHLAESPFYGYQGLPELVMPDGAKVNTLNPDGSMNTDGMQLGPVPDSGRKEVAELLRMHGGHE